MRNTRLMDEIQRITLRVPFLDVESDRIAYLVSPEEWKQLEKELALMQCWMSDDNPPGGCTEIRINHVEVRKR